MRPILAKITAAYRVVCVLSFDFFAFLFDIANADVAQLVERQYRKL